MEPNGGTLKSPVFAVTAKSRHNPENIRIRIWRSVANPVRLLGIL
jgi:hypothetical protein